MVSRGILSLFLTLTLLPAAQGADGQTLNSMADLQAIRAEAGTEAAFDALVPVVNLSLQQILASSREAREEGHISDNARIIAMSNALTELVAKLRSNGGSAADLYKQVLRHIARLIALHERLTATRAGDSGGAYRSSANPTASPASSATSTNTLAESLGQSDIADLYQLARLAAILRAEITNPVPLSSEEYNKWRTGVFDGYGTPLLLMSTMGGSFITYLHSRFYQGQMALATDGGHGHIWDHTMNRYVSSQEFINLHHSALWDALSWSPTLTGITTLGIGLAATIAWYVNWSERMKLNYKNEIMPARLAEHAAAAKANMAEFATALRKRMGAPAADRFLTAMACDGALSPSLAPAILVRAAEPSADAGEAQSEAEEAAETENNAATQRANSG